MATSGTRPGSSKKEVVGQQQTEGANDNTPRPSTNRSRRTVQLPAIVSPTTATTTATTFPPPSREKPTKQRSGFSPPAPPSRAKALPNEPSSSSSPRSSSVPQPIPKLKTEHLNGVNEEEEERLVLLRRNEATDATGTRSLTSRSSRRGLASRAFSSRPNSTAAGVSSTSIAAPSRTPRPPHHHSTTAEDHSFQRAPESKVPFFNVLRQKQHKHQVEQERYSLSSNLGGGGGTPGFAPSSRPSTRQTNTFTSADPTSPSRFSHQSSTTAQMLQSPDRPSLASRAEARERKLEAQREHRDSLAELQRFETDILPESSEDAINARAVGGSERRSQELIRRLFSLRLSENSIVRRRLSERGAEPVIRDMNAIATKHGVRMMNLEAFHIALSEILMGPQHQQEGQKNSSSGDVYGGNSSPGKSGKSQQQLPPSESRMIFNLFDDNRSGIVDLEEFAQGVRLLLQDESVVLITHLRMLVCDDHVPMDGSIAILETDLMFDAMVTYYSAKHREHQQQAIEKEQARAKEEEEEARRQQHKKLNKQHGGGDDTLMSDALFRHQQQLAERRSKKEEATPLLTPAFLTSPSAAHAKRVTQQLYDLDRLKEAVHLTRMKMWKSAHHGQVDIATFRQHIRSVNLPPPLPRHFLFEAIEALPQDALHMHTTGRTPPPSPDPEEAIGALCAVQNQRGRGGGDRRATVIDESDQQHQSKEGDGEAKKNEKNENEKKEEPSSSDFPSGMSSRGIAYDALDPYTMTADQYMLSAEAPKQKLDAEETGRPQYYSLRDQVYLVVENGADVPLAHY